MWCCLCLGLLLSPLVRAESSGSGALRDHVLHSAYWVDVEGTASLEQVRQQPHVPFEGFLNRGYTDAVHWIRLTLAPSTTPVGLRILPIWLDEVALHLPGATDRPPTVGDRHRASANSFAGLGLSFELPASSEPRDVWLRLKTSSAHRLQVQALPVDQIPLVNARDLIWAALYVTALLLVFLVLLGVWFTQPERVLGTFLVRHLCFTAFGAGYLGLPTLLLSTWLPPLFFDLTFSLVVIASLPLVLRFDMALLSTYGPQRHLLAALRVIAWAGVGLLVLLLAGYPRLALEINAHLMTLTVVLLFVTAWSCKPDTSVEQLMPKRLMMAYYTLLLGGLFLGLAGILAWFKPSSWQANILIYHGLASALLMGVMLFVRGQRQLARNRQVRWQLQQAQREVEQEQRRRHEQSQFLHMLMHELKTPLSVVSMALGTRDNKAQNLQLASRAVQDMKAVIERCIQVDRLGQDTLAQHLQDIDLEELIRQQAQALPEQQARLSLALSPALRVHTDPQLLRIIVTNLLDNALRYGEAGSPVRVALQAQEHEGRAGAQVCVDNRPGPAGRPDPAKLFTKYYRAPGARRESGSGLGLFLARQLAITLGGRLSHVPNDDCVRFELWLPITPA